MGVLLDFNAPEIDRVSVVAVSGAVYRSTWPRAIDAVSAVLMRDHAMGEYVLDLATCSNTDFVLTFPTREYYVSSTAVHAPFSGSAGFSGTQQE